MAGTPGRSRAARVALFLARIAAANPHLEHTVYSLASVSKPMAGTALMTLVQAGKIELDRPVNDYLGAAKLRARVGDVNLITVRRVADHTAGLPMHWQFFYEGEPYRQPSLEETILNYGNVVMPPGERFNYSNLGYGVIDSVIERASGLSFADYMQREVFVPLGMTRNSVDIAPALREFVAVRYGADDRPLPFFTANHRAASAVYSSVHDVVRFGMFHLKAHLPDQKPILSDASLDEMHRKTADRGDGFGYGVGFEVSTVEGRQWVHHSGGMDGVTSNLVLLPKENIAIAVVQNKRGSAGPDIATMVLAELLPSRPSKQHSRPAVEDSCASPKAPRGVWRRMLDTYVGEKSLELRFMPGGEQVQVRLGDQMTTLVNHPSCEGSAFAGEFMGRIGTPDTDQYRYRISLSLRLRDGSLNGTATAIQEPGPRGRAALAHWVSLQPAR